MPGTWTVTRTAVAPIHTFTAPEAGWLVTSHIIELPMQLLVVDAQYRLSYAREVSRYANALNKPVSRLYVTHYHPDHILGAEAFAASVYALRQVATKIGKVGDRVAREEHAIVGDDAPDHARRPDHQVREGDEIVDGVNIRHIRLTQVETEDALVIGLPDARVIIAQDLVYNRAHVFLGERNFDSWRVALRTYRDLPYDIVLPGHGLPGGNTLYDRMIAYLDFAQEALRTSVASAEFVGKLEAQFPDYGCHKVLHHQLRFLFPGEVAAHA
jgi:glyoxylase-like metal-dependent hydrolase (beta-lactamase superfamily II)